MARSKFHSWDSALGDEGISALTDSLVNNPLAPGTAGKKKRRAQWGSDEWGDPGHARTVDI